MNKQRHRLVFNARRGQIMAVAESASCVSGDGKTSSVGLVLSVVLLFSASVQAQIIADPQAPTNQRPTIHSAPNGVPLVNIQTPTAGGVSRNTYQRFDVQRDGVSRATLTTGKPVFENGSLEGFRVQGGNVRIEGAGLDAASADYTAILARAVEVNAGIWARELKVVTGANDVSADTATISANPASATGGAPAYALDVAQLGGMYASKIHLVGTEAGVGVNLRGVAGATAGDVVVEASGRLQQNGTLQASGDVRVQAQGALSNEGEMYAGGALSIASGQTLSNSGQINATGALQVHAQRLENETGAGLASSSEVQIRVDDGLINRGDVVTAGRLIVQSTALDNIAGRLHGQRIDVQTGDLENTGQVQALGDLSVQVDGQMRNTGWIAAQRNVTMVARTVDSSGVLAAGLAADGQRLAAGNLLVSAAQTLRAAGDNVATGLVSLTGGAVDLRGSQSSAERMNLHATTGDVDTRAATVVATDTLTVRANGTSDQQLNNAGGKISAGHLQLEVANLDNRLGILAQIGHADTVIALQTAAQARKRRWM